MARCRAPVLQHLGMPAMISLPAGLRHRVAAGYRSGSRAASRPDGEVITSRTGRCSNRRTGGDTRACGVTMSGTRRPVASRVVRRARTSPRSRPARHRPLPRRYRWPAAARYWCARCRRRALRSGARRRSRCVAGPRPRAGRRTPAALVRKRTARSPSPSEPHPDRVPSRLEQCADIGCVMHGPVGVRRPGRLEHVVVDVGAVDRHLVPPRRLRRAGPGGPAVVNSVRASPGCAPQTVRRGRWGVAAQPPGSAGPDPAARSSR